MRNIELIDKIVNQSSQTVDAPKLLTTKDELFSTSFSKYNEALTFFDPNAYGRAILEDIREIDFDN